LREEEEGNRKVTGRDQEGFRKGTGRVVGVNWAESGGADLPFPLTVVPRLG